MNETERKNLAINSYSCLKENGKKINYMRYIKERKNTQCNEAILRVFGNIHIKEIERFIDETEFLSDMRKHFYKELILKRYEIIRLTYLSLAQGIL